MISRRQALSALSALGIGSAAFQRSLAAQTEAGFVTRKMVEDAEWVAGIELSDEQRQMAADWLNEERDRLTKLRMAKLDNGVRPPFVFKPIVSSKSAPDPRSYVKAAAVSNIAPLSKPNSDEELAFLPLRKIGQLLRRGDISSAELTRLYLDRLQRFDPLLKCVVTFTDSLALRQAKKADDELKRGKDRGPLHGIPWGAKDLLAHPEFPTTWGAPQYSDRMIDQKAAVIERLENAGAVMVAKLATGAFAGENFWSRGKTRNPWNPHQGSWGSSSGPASATAAGLVGFSIGTETMGSIKAPCTRCGAVGLRPTYGRVSRYGCMTLCWSLDKIGPICRTVDDCGLVLGEIHGADPRDPSAVDSAYVWPTARKMSTVRVGYFDDTPEEDLNVLRELGVKLVHSKRPSLPEDIEMPIGFLEATVTAESSAAFDQLTRVQEPKGVKMWPAVWVGGNFLTAIDYLKLSQIRTLLMQQTDELFQKVDVCIGYDGRTSTNVTGHPMIVLPRGFSTEDGFETPLTRAFFGRNYDETTLLAVAAEYQRLKTGEEYKHPPLERFLKEIDSFHGDEEFPDMDRLYAEEQ